MDKNRQQLLLNILLQAQEGVENGKEVTTEFARLLFPPERKEYELTYFGKESEQAIISQTFAAPIQLDRIFSSEDDDNWVNKIIFGDNLQILKSLIEMKKKNVLKNEDGTDGVRLIYIDPPFASQQDFSNNDQKAYADKIKGAEFLEWLRKRLILLREILADNGSIYIHLDWHKSHYIKVLMDEVFGEGNFQNEIIWHYNKFAGKSGGFPLNHDSILVYSKTKQKIFNKLRIPVQNKRKQTARIWDSKQKKAIQKRDANGKLIYYDQEDKAVDDTWLDIPAINPMAKERKEVNYPTQKPEKLLKRVIEASSNPGDLILDAFGGSGTTAVVAEKSNRRWITIDVGKLAIYTIQKRMLNVPNHHSFAVYNAGHYDENKLNLFEKDEWKKFAMALYNVEPHQQIINGFTFDGLKDGEVVKVFSPQDFEKNAKITEETLTDIYQRLNSSLGNSEIFIIAPQGKFGFAVDEFDNDGNWNILFNILRVPYSMDQKFTEQFSSIKQAVDSESINDAIDAVGFDFIRPPKVSYTIDEQRLSITDFKAFSRIKGAYKQNGFDSFSMVLVDFNYDGITFKLDKTFFKKDFDENKSISFDDQNLSGKIMLIFIDKFGNEFKTIQGEK